MGGGGDGSVARVVVPGGAAGAAMPSSSSGRARQASRGPPSAYRISRVARRPGGPYRLRATSTALRCPTTSRPRRIQPERRSSRRRPLASSTATARARPSEAGSSTIRSVPARRASAASLPSRSPTRFPATAGSRPSGRSMTSRSTVRAASSAPARASASSRSTGVRTTSHSGRTPRATASTGSKARARSSHATIAPPACASAAVRSATVVLPEDAAPRNATVAARGSPPGPRMASSAANPVGTMRPSASVAGVPGRRVTTGARGVGARGVGARGSGAPAGSPVGSGAGSGIVIGARARAPSVASTKSPPRRGAAEPQRAWRVASASEMSDAGAIGRPIIERLFYSSRANRRCSGYRRHPRDRHRMSRRAVGVCSNGAFLAAWRLTCASEGQRRIVRGRIRLDWHADRALEPPSGSGPLNHPRPWAHGPRWQLAPTDSLDREHAGPARTTPRLPGVSGPAPDTSWGRIPGSAWDLGLGIDRIVGRLLVSHPEMTRG